MVVKNNRHGVTGGQAVTIDDVVCVINSGRHKEKSYDPYTNVSTLQAAWVSKASERQRRGRAGRCQQARRRRRCSACTEKPELPMFSCCMSALRASAPAIAAGPERCR